MKSLHCRRSYSVLARGIAVALALLATAGGAARANLLFTETFQYTIGSNLSGQNGGTGFSTAWNGGNSTIVAGLSSGSSSAVQIGTQSLRSLSATASTSGTSTYVTYLMNASSFSGGNYTGLSLWNSGTEQMFLGIPWQAFNFGFDAHGGNGAADIKTVNFTPSPNTSYLVAVGFLPSATPGKVDVKMWATSNLAVDPNALIATPANASLIGSRNNFSFNQISVAGDYAGSLKVAGIASSPSVSEAASVSVNAVPEPDSLALVATLVGGCMALRARKR